MKKAAIIVAIATASTAPIGCRPPTTTCQSDSECRDRELCFAGTCLKACNSTSECEGGESCINGVCQPGGVLPDAATRDRLLPDAPVLDRALADRGGSDRHDAATAAEAATADRPWDAAPGVDVSTPTDADTIVDSAAGLDVTGGDVDSCPIERCADSYCRTASECCDPEDCGTGAWTCSTAHRCSCRAPNLDCEGDCRAGTSYYSDDDGDGFGDDATPGAQVLCGPNLPYRALQLGDCNDDDATVFPAAPELCDGKSNNCSNLGLADGSSCAGGADFCCNGGCQQCCLASQCGAGAWSCNANTFTCDCPGMVCGNTCCGDGDFYCDTASCVCDGVVCGVASATRCWGGGECCVAATCRSEYGSDWMCNVDHICEPI